MVKVDTHQARELWDRSLRQAAPCVLLPKQVPQSGSGPRHSDRSLRLGNSCENFCPAKS